MFHIRYPKFRGFFTWDELGCLSRAIGFSKDLFVDNLKDEIEQEEHGLGIKELYKMFDYCLLESALHRTNNLHSAEWNTKVLKKALTLLGHCAITFEELYNTRVAYQAYESFDMKGMCLDQHTLLCTLRMCRRSIAPMKLAHRIKHMRGEFEERGRIQLYEFLDLVMWCGVYEKYVPEDVQIPDGMENDLFLLVDFEKLLSHHDQRLNDRLNAEYLKEEWDFGRENLGGKQMFKEPPVKCAEDRINMTRAQKRMYRHLKAEIAKSQKTVYRSKAGFVRDRPLTAPNLSMYQRPASTTEQLTYTAHNAYEMIQRKVKPASAKTREKIAVDTSDRPQYVKAVSTDKPRVISEREIEEAKKKVEVLAFDSATMNCRLQKNMDETMESFYPGYKEKQLSEEDDFIEICIEPSPRSPTTEENINRLAYSESHIPSTRGKTCDARLRANSFKGHLYQVMAQSADDPVRHIIGDVLNKRTKNSNKVNLVKGQRPSTAPPSCEQFTSKTKEVQEKNVSPSDSYRTVDTGYNSYGDSGQSLDEMKQDVNPDVKTKEAWNRQGSLLRIATVDTLEQKDDDAIHGCLDETTEESSDGLNSFRFDKINFCDNELDVKTKPKIKKKASKQRSPEQLAPVPQMEHSKPVSVPVGGIGTISLLESISESQYWEDVCNEDKSSTYEESIDSSRQDESSVDSGQEEDIELTLSLLKRRLGNTIPQKSRKHNKFQNRNKKNVKRDSRPSSGASVQKKKQKVGVTERPKSETDMYPEHSRQSKVKQQEDSVDENEVCSEPNGYENKENEYSSNSILTVNHGRIEHRKPNVKTLISPRTHITSPTLKSYSKKTGEQVRKGSLVIETVSKLSIKESSTENDRTKNHFRNNFSRLAKRVDGVVSNEMKTRLLNTGRV